jgi:hypothetical protein
MSHLPDGVAAPSSGNELAAAIRRLNAKLGELPSERVAELQADWGASWEELQRQREGAADKRAELDAVAEWERHWRGVLGV